MNEERAAMSSKELDSSLIRVLWCAFPQCDFRSQSKESMSMHMNLHVQEQFVDCDYAESDELERNFHSVSHNKDPNHHNIKSYNVIIKNLKKLNVSERNNQNARKLLDKDELKDTSDLDSYYLSTPEGLAGPYFKCSKCNLIIKRPSKYTLHVQTCKGNPEEAMDESEDSDSSSCESQMSYSSDGSKSTLVSDSSEEEGSLLRRALEDNTDVRPAKSVAQVSIPCPSAKGEREEEVGRPSEMTLKPEDNILEVYKSPGSHSNRNFRTKGNQDDLVKSVRNSACSNKANNNAEKELKICSKCPYDFSDKREDTILAHIRLHSDPKAIVCSIPDCYYRTDRMCNLKDHIRVNHGKSSFKRSKLDSRANKSGEPKRPLEPYNVIANSAAITPQKKHSRRDFSKSQGVYEAVKGMPQITDGGSDEDSSSKERREISNKMVKGVKAVMMTKEPAQSKSLASAQNPGKRAYRKLKSFPQCPYCPFKSRNFLRHHIALHSDPSAVSCPVQGCYFKTKWPWYLKVHMKDKHPKFEEPPVIDKNGQSEGARMLGVENKDTRDQAQAVSAVKPRSPSPSMPKLRCISPIVGVPERATKKDSSTPKAQGINSQQSSASDGGTSFSCSISGCNFVSVYKSSLIPHVRRMHSKPTSQFLCSDPNCAYTSNWSRDLKRHIRRRHKRRETVQTLICEHDGCEFGTNVKRVLREHAEKTHHEISFKKAASIVIQHTSKIAQRERILQTSKIAQSERTQHNSKIAQGERFQSIPLQTPSKFVCTAGNCEFTSRWPQSLTAHIIRKHGKVPRIAQFTCGSRQCDFKTNVLGLLNHHRRTIHEGKSKVARNVTSDKENATNSRNCYQQNKPSGGASKSEKKQASCTFCSYASKLSVFLRKHFQPCPTCKSVNHKVHDEATKSTATQIDNQLSTPSSSTVNPMLACTMCKFVADSQVQAAVHGAVHKRPIVLVARLNVVR